jgi:hypothetical protein
MASIIDDPYWTWPEDIANNTRGPPGAFPDEYSHPKPPGPAQSSEQEKTSTTPPQSEAPKPQKHYKPRTCRICLEVVHPTNHPPPDNMSGILGSSTPHVTYESEDLGRLIRPCKCKGSSKWVHSGCLTQWRYADVSSKRNYWQCPTCGFKYRLERMRWGRWISSTFTQILLTVSILLFATFLSGFLYSPIVNLYVDPYETIRYSQFWDPTVVDDPFLEDDDSSWIGHFIKGLASLGVLSFIKVFFALSPYQWWNLRNSGLLNSGTRTGPTGRDRAASISWIVIVIGLGTFLWVSLWTFSVF